MTINFHSLETIQYMPWTLNLNQEKKTDSSSVIGGEKDFYQVFKIQTTQSYGDRIPYHWNDKRIHEIDPTHEETSPG